MKRWQYRLTSLERATALLSRARAIPQPDDTHEAGIVQFFEVAFELGWKTCKDFHWLPVSLALAASLPACTPSRPYYTGPGSMAATLPYQVRPTWLGQDTAAIYLSAYGGPAYRYNEFDENVAFGGQVSRGWAWENVNASAGAFGSSGRYTYAKSYAPERLARLTYGVAGVQVGGGLFPTSEYAVLSESGVEWRVLDFHASVAREWGAVAEWRARPADAQGQPLLFTTNLSNSPWLTTVAFGTELVARSPRPLAPNLAIGAGYQVRRAEASLYGTLAVGVGPLVLVGQAIGPGKFGFKKPVYQFSLSYVLTRR